MKVKIGCLHAHYSNIACIEQAFASKGWELTHFVDPGLISRMAFGEHFGLAEAERKVMEQIEWIASTRVDAILITCTNYIAMLNEGRLNFPVPIIKIDEPFFQSVCRYSGPQLLLFTNPATVEGTMNRLHRYAAQHDRTIEAEVRVIGNTFELLMQGKKEQYRDELSAYIRSLLASEPDKRLSVAQLSMVEAAGDTERESGRPVGNPLKTLVEYVEAAIGII
jgi:plasmid stability protein